jgi:hypothetical protein
MAPKYEEQIHDGIQVSKREIAKHHDVDAAWFCPLLCDYYEGN